MSDSEKPRPAEPDGEEIIAARSETRISRVLEYFSSPLVVAIVFTLVIYGVLLGWEGILYGLLIGAIAGVFLLPPILLIIGLVWLIRRMKR